MNFFNFDLHISVIEDLKNIFKELNHNINSICISGHNSIFNRPQPKSSIIETVNQYNWQNINQNIGSIFFNKYKDILKDYDGFVVTYPPAFALLYEKFEKPIIINVAIRYDVPFVTDKNKLNYFNDFLKNGIDNKKIILVANTIYEKKYCEYFLDRECLFNPNLCEYGNTYPKWTGQNYKYLLYNDTKLHIKCNLIDKKTTTTNTGLFWNWKDIEDYRGIIHIPYNISTMSMFEQYSANTPLFFPSKKFILELYKMNINILKWLSWYTYYNIEFVGKSDDPNNIKDINNISKWLDYAMFYDTINFPYLIYFDSFKHLGYLIKKNDYNSLKSISDNMSNFNKNRKLNIYNFWKNLLNNLKK